MALRDSVWNDMCVADMPIIHWVSRSGAGCGAPDGSFVSPYAHTVTCPRCIVALKLDLLERRLEAHRQSAAFARVRPVRPVK